MADDTFAMGGGSVIITSAGVYKSESNLPSVMKAGTLRSKSNKWSPYFFVLRGDIAYVRDILPNATTFFVVVSIEYMDLNLFSVVDTFFRMRSFFIVVSCSTLRILKATPPTPTRLWKVGQRRRSFISLSISWINGLALFL